MTVVLPRVTVTVSKTRDGRNDYMQIVSDDQFALNIVLVSTEIKVEDSREPARGKRKQK